MHRAHSLLVLLVAASAACDRAPLAPFVPTTRLLAQESLATVDGQALPCCGTPDATVTAGTLNFYAAASYPDTVFTPAGPMPAACVQEVPNGAYLHSNNTVTLGDSVAYILLPCSSGLFTITVQHAGLAAAEGSGGGIVSSGTYILRRDTIALADPGRDLTVAMHSTTISVSVGGHAYTFVPPAGR